MATSQQFLVCDSSTLANFKNWAQAISAFFTTAGWTQSADTGQVNWGTIASVPGTGAYVYEIWQPNDGLTTFFLKIEYGNFSASANAPSVRVTLSSGTNGSGTPNGFVSGPFLSTTAAGAPSSATATYECNFYGTSGSLAILMWRNNTSNDRFPFVLSVERSLNSSGSATGSHVTASFLGNSGTGTCVYNQQSLIFGIGLSPVLTIPSSVRGSSTSTSGASNGSIPLDLVSPYVGFWDQNLTTIGSACSTDFTEGITFTATVYSTSMTYMPSKAVPGFNRFGPGAAANYIVLVRTA